MNGHLVDDPLVRFQRCKARADWKGAVLALNECIAVAHPLMLPTLANMRDEAVEKATTPLSRLFAWFVQPEPES